MRFQMIVERNEKGWSYRIDTEEPRLHVLDVLQAFVEIMRGLLQTPMARIESVQDRVAREAEAAHVKAHPATRMLVKTGTDPIFLGGAVSAEVNDALHAQLWVDVAMPEGLTKGCDYARDPQTLLTRLGITTEPAN